MKKTPEAAADVGRMAARSDERELQVADLLCETLDAAPGTKVLVCGDRSRSVAPRLAAEGVLAEPWYRYALGDAAGQSWPEGERFDVATLRVPSSWAAFEFQVHAALSKLAVGGQLIVYGRNDEGAKSVARRLKPFGEARTLETKRRSRVLSLTWSGEAALKAQFEDWLVPVAHPHGLDAPWVTGPGLFAKGQLDAATAQLLDALPNLYDKRVLDFGCGQGVISDALLRSGRGNTVTAVDADAVAIEAVKRNVPEATAILSDGFASVEGSFQRIISNPPIHLGKSEDFSVLRGLIEGAPAHLTRSGELWLVVQAQVPLQTLLSSVFKTVERAQLTPRFCVWRAK